MKVLLSKHKKKWRHRIAPVYFNYTTKTVINSKYMLDKSFQEILYRIQNFINEGSGWVTESIFLFFVHYQEAHPLNYLVD